jgi:hypothetical protein
MRLFQNSVSFGTASDNCKIMVYGSTAHNGTVYASPPVGGSGYGFARSAAPSILHPVGMVAGLAEFVSSRL